MSNQPDQPQPYVPPGYYAPPVPPYIPPAQQEQPNYAQPNYAQPNYAQPAQQEQYAQPQFQQPPQFNAPAYYQGGPGYPGNYGPKGLSVASMVIGLVSIFLLGMFIVPHIVGVILGHKGLKQESPQGRGFAITGLVTNYLALVGYGLIVGLWVVLMVAVGSSSSYSY